MLSALECAASNVKTNLIDLYSDCCVSTYGPPCIMVNNMAKDQYILYLTACKITYKPNTLAPHGPPDASQTIALEMTWSKLLLNYTSPITQPLMTGLGSILNTKFIRV